MVFWDVFVLLIAVPSVIGFVTQGNPASIVFVAGGAMMIGFMHIMVWGFAAPDKNYVELRADRIVVKLFSPLIPLSGKIPYSLIDRVEEIEKHSWWPFGFWPYTPMGGFAKHIDVRLNHGRFLFGGWGCMSPIIRVIHLDVSDAQEFLSAVEARSVPVRRL